MAVDDFRKAHDAHVRGPPPFENRKGMGQPHFGGAKGGPARLGIPPQSWELLCFSRRWDAPAMNSSSYSNHVRKSTRSVVPFLI